MARTNNKNVLRSQVKIKLEESFPDIKAVIGDKKFSKRVKKAGKILAAGAQKKINKAELKKAKAKLAVDDENIAS